MSDRSKASTGQLFLKGTGVTSDFRDELFDAAIRASVTPPRYITASNKHSKLYIVPSFDIIWLPN